MARDPNQLQAIFTRAVAAFNAGDLAAAQRDCEAMLALDRHCPPARQMLGTLAFRRGDAKAAARHFAVAAKVQPGAFEAHVNLGLALLADGSGADGVKSLQTAARLAPTVADVHNHLGNGLRQVGRLPKAVEAYRQAARLAPRSADFRANLAVALYETGEYSTAETEFRAALAMEPAHLRGWTGLAMALGALGRRGDAVESWRHAVRLRADHAASWVGLGKALIEADDFEPAVEACTRAIALAPDAAETYTNLGVALDALGRTDEAIAAYRHAIALAPGMAKAHNNLGSACDRMGLFDAAEAAYRRALALAPDYANAHNNLGSVLGRTGRAAEAIACHRAALKYNPGHVDARVNLCYQRRHACDWQGLEADEQAVLALIESGQGWVHPFPVLGLPSDAAQQLACARAWVGRMPMPAPAAHYREAEAGPIRLGYLSADFRAHPVAALVAEIFELHDRERFTVTGYAIGPDDGSDMRERIAAAFDRFVDLRPLADADALRRIAADGIDILVDLNGHTDFARLGILAGRPAPVQATWLGFPGTTGAPFIDYAVVDGFVCPPGSDRFFSEHLVRLPACYQPNDRRRPIAGTPDRAACGLPAEGFVFCCFNTAYKLTPAVFGLWMRLLAQLPGAVLWLLEGSPAMRDNLRREAEARGIAAERLVFAPRLDYPAHLARHRCADLFLDTLPYNAHTTASDALWTGLPVLTCAGETFAGRVAGSLVSAVGLGELITTSAADYEAAALRLARDTDMLAGLRAKLARNLPTAPLFDSVRFTRDLEAAYARMWDIRRSGEAPRAFDV